MVSIEISVKYHDVSKINYATVVIHSSSIRYCLSSRRFGTTPTLLPSLRQRRRQAGFAAPSHGPTVSHVAYGLDGPHERTMWDFHRSWFGSIFPR